MDRQRERSVYNIIHILYLKWTTSRSKRGDDVIDGVIEKTRAPVRLVWQTTVIFELKMITLLLWTSIVSLI
jgi:hypothetical protein